MGSYTIDAELFALDGRFVEGGEGLWSFVQDREAARRTELLVGENGVG